MPKLHLTLTGTTAARTRLERAGGPPTDPERKAMAADVALLVRRHLRTRDDTHPHTYPQGGHRTHFWRQAANAVSFAAPPDAIEITIAHLGVKLRYHGAPQGIAPVNAKALAIPAHARAYGRLPYEFDNLRIAIFKKSNRAALIEPGTTPGEPPTILFWLIKRTKPIPPDPTVLPPPDTTLATAMQRLRTIRNIP